MEFCPKCGAMLIMKKAKAGCPRCSYIAKEKINMEIKKEIEQTIPIAVVDEKEANVNPITEWECKKCNHKRSYFWIRQMRAGDEAESKFYQCVKCRNTTRVDE